MKDYKRELVLALGARWWVQRKQYVMMYSSAWGTNGGILRFVQEYICVERDSSEIRIGKGKYLPQE